jgi:predicted dienelactone hydrolase
MARVTTGVVVAVVIFLAFSAVMRVQSVTLPDPTGPSAVGRIEVGLTDAARIDPFATDGRTREIAVWIWYPAVDGASGATAEFLPSAWAPLVHNEGPLSQDLAAVKASSLVNPPLAGRPPVVVLMPGLGEPVASYTTLAEELASHGYAVVGVNPTESADVVFPDGHVVRASTLGAVSGMTIDEWYASAERVTSVWADDAAFVVGSLESSQPPIGALDFDHVAYVGHSVGGAASFEACRQDAQCAAAVNLDGTLWTEVRHTGLDAPSLLLEKAAGETCDGFCARAAEDFATFGAAPNVQRFAIEGSAHANFSDMGLMWGPTHALSLGSIDAHRMSVITRDMVLSFLDVHVRDMPATAVSEAAGRYAEVQTVD